MTLETELLAMRMNERTTGSFFVRAARDAQLPQRHYAGDAGFDLYAYEDAVLPSQTWRRIRTGVRFTAGSHQPWFGLVQERSSQALKGLFTFGNVVDAGYRGELSVVLFNFSPEPAVIRRGDAIAQLILLRRFILPAEDMMPERRARGFGSTDGPP